MKAKIIIGFALLLGIIGCEKEDEKSDNLDAFSILYTESSSWVGYYHSVKLDQNGTMQVIYQNELANYYRENSYQIRDTDIVILKDNLAILSSINLADSYGFVENKPTDLTTANYSYQTNIKSDSTLIYAPEEKELPDELVSFIKVLNKIITDTDTLLLK